MTVELNAMHVTSRRTDDDYLTQFNGNNSRDHCANRSSEQNLYEDMDHTLATPVRRTGDAGTMRPRSVMILLVVIAIVGAGVLLQIVLLAWHTKVMTENVGVLMARMPCDTNRLIDAIGSWSGMHYELLSDCQEVLANGATLSGSYGIYLNKSDINSLHKVYCDMTTDGGGWTVLMRRMDGSTNFARKWTGYKEGFGDLSGEFWAGNDFMHLITSVSGKTFRLRVTLGSYDDEERYAEYDIFRMDSEQGRYRLHVQNYTGNAGDSFSFANNAPFSTPDQDNDSDKDHCSMMYSAGFWYTGCARAKLTGVYGRGLPGGHGILWYAWMGRNVQLKSASMMVRAHSVKS